MELDEPSTTFDPPKDPRPKMPEPPVVRVEAIEDVRLPIVAGLEADLVSFYVELLKFERLDVDTSGLVLKAENVRVVFTVGEGSPHRQDLRPMIVMVPHFAELVKMLDAREIPYEWQRGIVPGTDTLLVRDPAGNWVCIGWRASVR